MGPTRLLILALTIQSFALFAYILARSAQTYEDARSENVRSLALVAVAFAVLAIFGAGYVGVVGIESLAEIEALLTVSR